jgi:hypothetical protein
MTTLLDLVREPSTQELTVEEYDFESQTRFSLSPQMFMTTGTIATFDWQGKPKDSQSDNND